MPLPTYGVTMGDPSLATLSSHSSSIATLLATVDAQGTSITSLLSASQMPSAFLTTQLLPPLATTTATALADDKTYFQYIGRINKSCGSCRVAYYLKTSLIPNVDPATDWGEIAVWKGVPTDPATTSGIPASLFRLGFIDCNTEAQFQASPGLLSAVVSWTSSNCPAGSDLWVSFGSKAGTNAQFESTVINRFGFGIALRADGQSSTLGTTDLVASGLSINSTVGSPVVTVWFS